jgi:immune inhibitor A
VNGTKIATSASNSSVIPEGIEGAQADWTDVTADLSAYAGQTVTVRFGYTTDGGVQGASNAFPAGISLDDIDITGQPLDGAETDAGWTFATNSQDGVGFHVTTGTETFSYFNAYVVENRQYLGYDKALKSGPYNFDDPAGNFVTHFPYQDGMLVWYWDMSRADNNVGDHPGEGLILPIDAHPAIMHYTDGSVARVRLQSYDSTFTLRSTDAFTLQSTAFGTLDFPSEPGVSVFDDSQSHWTASDPGDALGHYQAGWISVNHPNTGTTIRVKSISATGFMQVDFNK